MSTSGRRFESRVEIHAAEEEPAVRLAAPPPAGREESTLADAIAVLVERRWLIGLVAAAALAAGVLHALLATPVYRTDALVQVEERLRGTGALDELAAIFSESSPTEAEIEILRSRSLVGSVVDELELTVAAEPRRFPVVGGAIARLRDGDEPAGAILGLSGHAWGGERIAVQRLDVPARLEGARLTLVAGDAGRFTLLGPDGEAMLAGRVGESARAAEPGGEVAIVLARLVARPGTEFAIVKRGRDDAIDRLRRGLSISEVGKKTGIIRLELEGDDRELIAVTLDALARAYLRQNVERRSEEAEKALQFLETQLPVLKSNLDAAESALSQYRSRNGSVDITLETRGHLDRAAEVERLLSELEVQRAELRGRFTENHPVMIALRQKGALLEAERGAIDAKIKQLPQAELLSARLMRDVKVANELYVFLLNKAQELRVMKSSTIGNVRIVDESVVPAEPVRPRKAAGAALALVLGLGLGVALAFARNALDRGVRDPEVIERSFGVGVYAPVPHTPKQAELERALRRKGAGSLPILASADPADVAVESLRTLRTSLEFALVEADGNAIAIAGPTLGVGKSFIAVNLAAVLAGTGKRVLLVDGDMRKGRLHRHFGLERSPGLSEVITGSATVEEAVRTTATKDVSLLPTGRVPPNPSELLASERFRRLVADLGARYDVVLIDTAPVLAVTDATLVGRVSAITVVVLRAGRHSLGEITLAVKRLAQSGVRPHGFVLNDVVPRPGAFHPRYGYED